MFLYATGVETPKWPILHLLRARKSVETHFGVLRPILGMLRPILVVLRPKKRVMRPILRLLRPVLGVLRPIFSILRPIFSVLRPTLVMLRPILRVVVINRAGWRPFLDSVGGGAWPFLFGDVICLVDHVNDRDFSLLNSVQHDSYLTAFYKDTVCATEGCVRQKRACDAFQCSVFCHCGFL